MNAVQKVWYTFVTTWIILNLLLHLLYYISIVCPVHFCILQYSDNSHFNNIYLFILDQNITKLNRFSIISLYTICMAMLTTLISHFTHDSKNDQSTSAIRIQNWSISSFRAQSSYFHQDLSEKRKDLIFSNPPIFSKLWCQNRSKRWSIWDPLNFRWNMSKMKLMIFRVLHFSKKSKLYNMFNDKKEECQPNWTHVLILDSHAISRVLLKVRSRRIWTRTQKKEKTKFVLCTIESWVHWYARATPP